MPVQILDKQLELLHTIQMLPGKYKNTIISNGTDTKKTKQNLQNFWSLIVSGKIW